MTRSMKHVGSAVLVALGLAVYVGCGAPASAEEMHVATTTAALTPTTCVQDSGSYAKWLPDASCSCAGYRGDALDQCTYELGVLTCLKEQGYKLNCASLPRLAIVSAEDNHKFISYYEDIDFNVFLPGNCRAQAKVFSCVKALNATNGPSGIPYTKPSVAAQLLNRCTPHDACNDYPAHADFDPCTTKACYQ